MADRLLEARMGVGEDNLEAEQTTLLMPRQEITPKRAFNTG
jgi:hypothetical protein